jgi:Terminase-like family.
MLDRVIWSPQDGPQKALIDCQLDEVFYGGARGGGKTDGALGKLAILATSYHENFNALFIRRELPMLDDAIERSKAIFGPIGAVWHEQQKTWRFHGGGRLRFRPLDSVGDADKYQGQNISHAVIEEAGLYPDPRPIDRLRAVLRSAAGVQTQLIMTGNPGGAGQSWIKARYIDPYPGGYRVMHRDIPLPEWAGGGVQTIKAVFIPSKVSDNKFLGRDYIAGLHLVGSEALVKAWLDGDWSAVEGAFFDVWQSTRNVCRKVELPDHWLRYRSFDWGYAKPFSVGWWAVASEDTQLPGLGEVLFVPRGCLIRYREWYGADGPNTGIRMEAEDIARGIRARDRDDRLTMAVADTQVFAQEGRAYGYHGPTIGERLNVTLAGERATIFRPADKSRAQGWDQVRTRMRGFSEGAMLLVFDTCVDFIRTVPLLQHDSVDPEDLDTEGEDHVADEARYAAMARPWALAKPASQT